MLKNMQIAKSVQSVTKEVEKLAVAANEKADIFCCPPNEGFSDILFNFDYLN